MSFTETLLTIIDSWNLDNPECKIEEDFAEYAAFSLREAVINELDE